MNYSKNSYLSFPLILLTILSVIPGYIWAYMSYMSSFRYAFSPEITMALTINYAQYQLIFLYWMIMVGYQIPLTRKMILADLLSIFIACLAFTSLLVLPIIVFYKEIIDTLSEPWSSIMFDKSIFGLLIPLVLIMLLTIISYTWGYYFNKLNKYTSLK